MESEGKGAVTSDSQPAGCTPRSALGEEHASSREGAGRVVAPTTRVSVPVHARVRGVCAVTMILKMIAIAWAVVAFALDVRLSMAGICPCKIALCDGDADGDGDVDGADWDFVLDLFLDDPCEDDCGADANCDGVIDFCDLTYVVERFGTCEPPPVCAFCCDPPPIPPDSDKDGYNNDCDGCPNDPDKQDPGECGCGVDDQDADRDGTPDCHDGCPFDPFKIDPGECGCGVSDDDSDGDGTPNCHDGCPFDPDKDDPGICGCGVPDSDGDDDGALDCFDLCPDTPFGLLVDSDGCPVPGICCFVEDVCFDGAESDDCLAAGGQHLGEGLDCDLDPDGDGAVACADYCPLDPDKTDPGLCGCGISDELDEDMDGVVDCVDLCLGTPEGLPVDRQGCPLIGACCFGIICFEGNTSEDCETAGGVYQGDGTMCDMLPIDCAEQEVCEGDANGDGIVDPLDSGFVLARFGCPVGTGDPSCDTADMNGDGLVDPLDSGFVLARFGDCP